MPTLCKNMHMDSCMRAYSTVQQLLCHGGYCELILGLARTSCRLLFTACPTARSLPALRDVVRSRNPSKSTLAHDAVANAMSHKHHSIIRIGAGLIQFVYGLHSHLAADLIPKQRILFSPWFSRVLINSLVALLEALFAPEELEEAGYKSPTWAVLRALQQINGSMRI